MDVLRMVILIVMLIPSARLLAQTQSSTIPIVTRPGPQDAQVKQDADRARQELEKQLSQMNQRKQDPAKSVAPKPVQDSDSIVQIILAIKDAQRERQQKLDMLSSEIDSILLEIDKIAKSRIEQQQTPPANSVQNAVDSQVNVPNNDSQQNAVEPAPLKSSNPEQEAAKQMVDLGGTPVDEISLANNLYASENYQTALKIYKKLAKEQVPPNDHNWIRFQLGNCFQKQNLFVEAEKYYREAANSEVQDISNSMSKWWLDQIENKKIVYQEISNMDAQISSIQQANGAGTEKNESKPSK